MPVSALKGLPADRRGAVAVWAALSLPTLLLAAGLGLEVSQWLLARMELQRTADIAADAGALRYAQTQDTNQAVSVATRMAELNGVAASNISVLVGAGLRDPTNGEAVTVTVSRSVPASFSRLIGLTATTVSATAGAETWNAAANPPACVLTLGGQSSGVTEQTDITDTGHADLSLAGCSLRSDAGISVAGNVTLQANGIYASGGLSVSGSQSSITSTTSIYTGSGISANGGTITATSSVYSGGGITTSGSSKVTAGSDIYAAGSISDLSAVHGGTSTQPNTSAGPRITQEADPYLSYDQLQSALAATNTVATQAASGSSLSPGVYPNLSIMNAVTLNPGLYVVTGNVSVSSGSLTGTGVTIVVGGSVSLSGNGTLSLTAPDPAGAAAHGGVPGIVMASKSGGFSLSGGKQVSLTGVLYFPNSTISIAGNVTLNPVPDSTTSGTTSTSNPNCLEMIASTLSVSGDASMAGDCTSLGAPPIPSLASTPVTLVR